MRQVPYRIGFGPWGSRALAPIRLLVASFLALGWLGTMAQAEDNGIISGRVTDPRGQPLAVLVHLLAEGDIPAGDAYAESNGTYVFTGLTSGTYSVVVEVDGYKPFRGSTRLDDKVQPRGQVMVLLEPVEPAASPSIPRIPGSKSANEVSAKHAPLPLNPKAVREFDKGNKDRENGNTTAALEHYQKALRIDADFYPALNNMGALLEQQGNHAQAEAVFRKAAEINPEDGEAFINIGHVLYEQGRLQDAIDQLNQGLQRSPESAVGNFFLGSAYFKLRDADKAEPLLRRACTLDPMHMAPAHLQLANLYLQRREYEAAKVQLEIYLQLNPSAPQAPAIKKTLTDLAKNSRQ